MRGILLLSFLFLTVLVGAQDSGRVTRSLKKQVLTSDSSFQKIIERSDSARLVMELKQREESNTRALLQLSEDIKRRSAKEKRNAMLRIGFGVLLFAVLVVGLRRRRAKK